MMDPNAVKLLLLARLIAYMLLVYLGFGLVVELKSRRPESKLKGFARLLCRPLVGPVGTLMAKGTPYLQVLKRTFWVALGLWLLLVVGTELLLGRG